jgi:hypothetical protein
VPQYLSISQTMPRRANIIDKNIKGLFNVEIRNTELIRVESINIHVEKPPSYVKLKRGLMFSERIVRGICLPSLGSFDE